MDDKEARANELIAQMEAGKINCDLTTNYSDQYQIINSNLKEGASGLEDILSNDWTVCTVRLYRKTLIGINKDLSEYIEKYNLIKNDETKQEELKEIRKHIEFLNYKLIEVRRKGEDYINKHCS